MSAERTGLEALADEVCEHAWEHDLRRTAHSQHQFHAFCEVCRGNVEAIAAVVLASDWLADDRGNEREAGRAEVVAAVEVVAAEWERDRDVCLAWIADPAMHVDADHPRRLSDMAGLLDRHAAALRDALHPRTSNAASGEPVEHPVARAGQGHRGGNAEDCPACDVRTLPYPFLCPGPAASTAGVQA